MRYWDAVLSFVVAAAIAGTLTPVAAWLARRLGAIDRPRDRGLSRRDTPLLGGLAILIAVLVGALIWLPGKIVLPRSPHSGAPTGGVVHVWVVLIGACVITVVGLIDD